MTAPALFIGAHPDDIVIMAGVAFAEHLMATPSQDISALTLTAGTASGILNVLNGAGISSWWGVQHNPAQEGYPPVTVAQFGDARVAENTAALRELGLGYPGMLAIHQDSLPDGAVTSAAAYTSILAVCDTIAPGAPVRLKPHTWLVDNHPDHLAAGLAVKQLKVDFPARFSDVRYYVEQPYWTDSRLSQVSEGFDTPANAGITTRFVNAVRCFGAWQPASGAFAVGQHSVPGIFATLLATPKSMVHP